MATQADPTIRGEHLAGVLPVFQIPFDDRFEIAYGDLESEVEWLFENGAAGIVMGMVSEILRLGTEERDTVAAAVGRMVAGRAPVVIGVTAESTYVAVHHTRVAEDVGASAVMCTLPIAARVLPAEAMSHFEQIVGATALPVIVQDASGYVGQELSVDMMARLEAEFPGRLLFKPETPPLGQRISELLVATGGRAQIYEGSGGIGLVDSFRRGIVGTMPAADLVWAVAALWAALQRGDEDTVRAIRGPLTALIALQGQLDTFVAIEKHLLAVQGVISSTRVRGPSGFVLDRETLEEAERLMAELKEATSQWAVR